MNPVSQNFYKITEQSLTIVQYRIDTVVRQATATLHCSVFINKSGNLDVDIQTCRTPSLSAFVKILILNQRNLSFLMKFAVFLKTGE